MNELDVPSMDLPRQQCKALCLHTAYQVVEHTLDTAPREAWPLETFLHHLLEQELAERIAGRDPESGILARRWKSTYTEGDIGAKHGFRVLTLTSLRRDGLLSEWHRPTDVVENVDTRVLGRCEQFLWELLQEIDKQAE